MDAYWNWWALVNNTVTAAAGPTVLAGGLKLWRLRASARLVVFDTTRANARRFQQGNGHRRWTGFDGRCRAPEQNPCQTFRFKDRQRTNYINRLLAPERINH